MSRSRWLLLLALFALALALRLGVVLALHAPDRPVYAYEHGEIAANLVRGEGFTVTLLGVRGPTSQQAPLAPWILAACYRLLGVATPAAHLAMQVLQCVVGASVVPATVLLAWQLAPQRPDWGWCAGWCAALFPPHVYMPTHIQAAVWGAALVVWLLAAAASSGLVRRRAGVAAVGVLVALVVLCDPILGIASVVALFVVWQTLGREYGWRSAAALWRVGILATVAVCTVAPWLVRNYQVHGEVVLVKSTFGYAFWQGNNAASWGTDKIPKALVDDDPSANVSAWVAAERRLWAARHETLYIDDVLLKPHGYARFAGLSEPARSRLLLAESMQFVREHPGEYFTLCLRRLQYLLLWDVTNPKTNHWAYQLCSLAWLTLAVAGLACLRRDWTRFWPTLAVIAGVGLFHVLTIYSGRFRLPLEPLAFPWAAAALTAAWRTLLSLARRSPKATPCGGAATAESLAAPATALSTAA